ncbi:MAG: TRAP transporter fused permease subunit [Alphaproteobacteria bacterium]
MTRADGEETLKGVNGILFAVGARRMPTGRLGSWTKLLALLVAAFVYFAAAAVVLDPIELTSIFLSMMLGLVFLVIGHSQHATRKNPPLFDVALSFAALAVGVYYATNADNIITRISLLDPLSTLDYVAATALWVLAIEATRRTVGLALTMIVVAMMAYNLFGHVLPGTIGHGFISYTHFLDQTAFTTNGIFGAPIRVAATYAFLFVAFGTFLEKCGGGDFFFDLAAAISGRSTGGPAKVAVVSSALYGTVSGSPTSDVVTTGSITIPMMRRLGYPRSLAGGIEVAASTSGGLLPPIMASAAFIMVEVTGIPYLDIATAAIIPALLYLFGVFLYVHLLSQKLGLKPMEKENVPSLVSTILDGGLFIIPIGVLVVALFMGYSINYVAILGTISVLCVSLLRRSTRLSLKAILEVAVVASIRMVPVAAACAAAGLVVGGISMTGLSGKLGLLIFQLAGDSVFLSLILSAVIAILLGMGMPTPSAYIMSAVLTAPILISLGMPLLSAHYFLLFFSVMSALTPPVAVAAYAASSLAEANPISIAGRSMLIAAPAFFLPFAFAFQPELLGQGSFLDIVPKALQAGVGVAAITVAAAGYLGIPLSVPLRLISVASGIALLTTVPAVNLAGGIGVAIILASAIGGRFGWFSALTKGRNSD